MTALAERRIEAAYYTQQTFDDLIVAAFEGEGNEIQLVPGARVSVAVNGQPSPWTDRRLSGQEIKDIAAIIGNPQTASLAASGTPQSGAYEFHRNGERYRCRYEVVGIHAPSEGSLGSEELHITLTLISSRIPTLDELRVPPALQRLMMSARQGSVIIVGATGSGKSTLLAALIRALAEQKARVITTHEDPIEHVHPTEYPNGSLVAHTAVSFPGGHIHKMSDAIRSVVRRRSQVHLTGEIRDWETLHAQSTLGLAGYLCLSSFHAANVTEAIYRIANMCPDSRYRESFSAWLLSTHLVVAQTLLPSERGRVAAREWLSIGDMERTIFPSPLTYLGRQASHRQMARAELGGASTLDAKVRMRLREAGRPFRLDLQTLLDSGAISHHTYSTEIRRLGGA